MSTTHDIALVRVERGTAGEEELAALTALLLARAAATRDPGPGTGRRDRRAARWSRPEHFPRYRSPLSWQEGV
ncbi:hypothetical protein AQJ66_25425 [Streptomyces bungoensis]|uniref:Acyl-CoA carboxylase subunit epsilon n=1 Tax=Streptomyces bungoensis TaxID=285568 RepID=A0A124I2L9_9ACTN|nr:acyl-CoA carboxylase epsilon subunit [Streptomyces bungoensis]KUN81011.1 hypothetical protein AQJ66_25425 [Streptomyces bungoensis]